MFDLPILNRVIAVSGATNDGGGTGFAEVKAEQRSDQ